MELALNLVWLITAVGSYALLARRLAKSEAGHSRRRSRCQCIIALSCALAILFPVISLTDDLHDMQAAVEEPSSSCVVMKRSGVHHPSVPIRDSNHLHYINPQLPAAVCWVAFEVARTGRADYPSPGFALTAFGRAPPPLVVFQIS